MRTFALMIAASAVFTIQPSLSAAATAPWAQILGPAQGTIPPPAAGDVLWRDDVVNALAEARRTNRPVFVTMRCLPCKQCAEFDKEVLEGGPKLTPLLKQFVTVRLVKGDDIDFNIFPVTGYQDLDLSWWGYFLSPKGELYGIFGGKDHISENTRISEAALINTMQRVLAHHYDPRRESWGIDGPEPTIAPQPRTVRQLPGFASWLSISPYAAKQECVHCHQVNDVLRQPAIDARTFDKHLDTQVWPLPENVGIVLDRDHGLRVESVEAGSAAAKAGVRAGDVLGAANGQKLFGQADFRGVLHRGPMRAGTIDLVWLRDGRVMTGTLVLTDGWRQTQIGWRASISGGKFGPAPGFWPLKGPDAGKGSMSIKPYWGKNPSSPAYDAGLKRNHIVIAVDGQSPDLFGRDFVTWFRMRYEFGDTVTLTVREGNQTKTIRYQPNDIGG